MRAIQEMPSRPWMNYKSGGLPTLNVRHIQQVSEIDRLACPDCGTTPISIGLIDDPGLCRVFFIRRVSGYGRLQQANCMYTWRLVMTQYR